MTDTGPDDIDREAARSRPERLLPRWTALFPGHDVEAAGQDLLDRYAEPVRRYHDRVHLAEVLAAVDLLAEHARDLTAVRLAAWFHDAVYDPRRGDNEAESARLARTVLPAYAADHLVAEVARLVELTSTHAVTEDDANGVVLCDADLAILAAPPKRYADYVTGVRAEYAHVEDDAFREGRARVLDGLLSHDRLFHTPVGRRDWEQRARHNVEAELLLLRGAD